MDRDTLHDLIAPFAGAAAALTFALAFLELLRPRFVSLFLDFRILALGTVVLALGAALTVPRTRGPRVGAAVLIVAASFAALLALVRATAASGRLGIVTLIAGVGAFLAVGFAALRGPAYDETDDRSL